MEIANAAALITAGPEPANMHTVTDTPTPDRSGIDGLSFAKSFKERIGESAFPEENKSPSDRAIASTGLLSGTLVKRSDEAVLRVDAGKAKTNAPVEKDPSGRLKRLIVNNPESEEIELVQKPAKTATGKAEKVRVEPTDEKDKAADDNAPLNSLVPAVLQAPEFIDRNFQQNVSKADGDHPLPLNGGETAIQGDAGIAGVVTGDDSPVKPTKMRGNARVPNPLQEDVRRESMITSKFDTASLMEAFAPVSQSAGTNVDVTQNDVSTKNEDVGKKDPVMLKSSVATSFRENIGARTETGSANAASVSSSSSDDRIESSKSAVGPETSFPVAVAASVDQNEKTKSVPLLGMGQIHGTAMGGVNSAVISATPNGNLVATKPLAGNANVTAQNLPVGSREQDDPGAVAGSVDGMPRLLAATPTSLEVGIQNGTHGWLKVRAEMGDAGGVNASISATSVGGQQILHRDLPGLSAYLQEEKVTVNVVEVRAASTAGADPRSSAGMSDTGGKTPQRGNEGGEPQQDVRRAVLDGSGGTGYQSLPQVDEDGPLPLVAYAGGGGWLSVRA